MAASAPLDAYSQIVAGVAAELTPKVASLRVTRGAGRQAESLGSAVVYTGDGFLLTNAHVVGSASGGTALFSDGTSSPFSVAAHAERRPACPETFCCIQAAPSQIHVSDKIPKGPETVPPYPPKKTTFPFHAAAVA